MREVMCPRCGANEWKKENGYRVCAYCGTVFQLTNSDIPLKESSIELNSDVERLLQKCKAEPKNASRYANLILDIDPDNAEALKYL